MRELKILLMCIFILGSMFIYSCAGTGQTSNVDAGTQPNDSVYVFDQPVNKDTVVEQPVVEPPVMEAKYYMVQIGAFTTKDKAESFSEEAKEILNQKVEISYSDVTNLFVVQLIPPYNKKEDAEKVRNNLWKTDKFKDAWILTVIR